MTEDNRHSLRLPPFLTDGQIREKVMAVLDGSLDLVISLAVFILIERRYGVEALGLFSYLFSLYLISSYIAEFGVGNYVRRETALTGEVKRHRAHVMAVGLRATIITGVGGAILLFGGFAYSTGLRVIDDRMISYFFLAAAIPLRNYNSLKMAALEGIDRLDESMKFRLQRRVIFLVGVLVLVLFGIAPALLTFCFLITEITLFFRMTEALKLPKIKNAFKRKTKLSEVLRQGGGSLFTDRTMQVVFYLDFLVLGMFVSAANLGAYTKAVILTRFMLIAPLSLRHIYRRGFLDKLKQPDPHFRMLNFQRQADLFFLLHAIIILLFSLNFPTVNEFFFRYDPVVEHAFTAFLFLAPGLLLYSSFAASEPIYYAVGKLDSMRWIIGVVCVVNFCLNFYLIPISGIYGAALATSAAMAVYFFLFGRGLPGGAKLAKKKYIPAAASIYILHETFVNLELSFTANLVLLPPLVVILFFLTGYFKEEEFSEKAHEELTMRTNNNNLNN